MADLKQDFEAMIEAVKNGTVDFQPSNPQKLKLYAFFKQATIGDVKGESPSMVQMVERAKWQAWNAIKGMDSNKAMESYIKVITPDYQQI